MYPTVTGRSKASPVRPSTRATCPDAERPARSSISTMSASPAPPLRWLPPSVQPAKETRELPVGSTALDVGEHFANAPAEPGRSPAEMSLEDLAHIHPAWPAGGVQHDIDRRTVVEVGHVLAWHDARNHTLVAV